MRRGIYNSSYTSHTDEPALDEIITKAIALHNNSDVYEAISILTEGLEQFPEAAELLWRRARWRCVMAERIVEKEEAAALFKLAETDARASLVAGADNFACWKAIAIVVGKIAKYQGLADKVKNSREVKDSIEKAIELNPNDAASHHVLGCWHHAVANLGWLAKSAIMLIYGGMPEASNEMAVQCFQHAISLEDYPPHHVELGKVYLTMGKKDEARASFVEAVRQGVKLPVDVEYLDEANQRLSEMQTQ